MNELRLKVIGSSMLPLLENQSEVLVRKQKKYSTGDVVAYWKTKSEISVHRIIKKSDNVIYTKGDANSLVDAQGTPQNQIIGKVFLVKKDPIKTIYNILMILRCRLGFYRLQHYQGGKLISIKKDKINLRRLKFETLQQKHDT